MNQRRDIGSNGAGGRGGDGITEKVSSDRSQLRFFRRKFEIVLPKSKGKLTSGGNVTVGALIGNDDVTYGRHAVACFNPLIVSLATFAGGLDATFLARGIPIHLYS